MAKPKSPLLSFGARGTIADALTFQKRGQVTIARKKPTPAYRYTLPQAYQRWDYRDYAYLWTLLSNSEKQVYRTKASRYHITGFSQWMREKLKDLPDIAGRWHLDEETGATAYDSSKNKNNGIIIGASPAAGLIAGGRYFNGINDWIDLGSPSALSVNSGTLVLRFRTSSVDEHHEWILYSGTAADRLSFYISSIRLATFYARKSGALLFSILSLAAVNDDQWHTAICPYGSTKAELWIDGVFQGEALGDKTLSLPANPQTLIGDSLTVGNYWYLGYLDEIALFSRIFDQAQIERHSERRYPI